MKREVTDKQLNVEYLPLDLASFQSTQNFVAAFKQKNLPLHILINNAGLAWVPLSMLLLFLNYLNTCVSYRLFSLEYIAKTADGCELQLQVHVFPDNYKRHDHSCPKY